MKTEGEEISFDLSSSPPLPSPPLSFFLPSVKQITNQINKQTTATIQLSIHPFQPKEQITPSAPLNISLSSSLLLFFHV